MIPKLDIEVLKQTLEREGLPDPILILIMNSFGDLMEVNYGDKGC